MKERKIYIMLSRTRTALGVLIQNVLDTEYNHCSLALDENPVLFYSFGRKRANRFWDGGFVFESKDFGFFKVFNRSQICILELEVTEQQYHHVRQIIEYFTLHKDSYGFNITGLALSKFSIAYSRERHYFCSQFVAQVLSHAGVYDFQRDCRLVAPPDMMTIPNAKIVYAGYIQDYNPIFASPFHDVVVV